MVTRSAAYAMYSGDWQYHDGIESVTFTKNGGAVLTGVKAKMEPSDHSMSSVGDDVAVQSDKATWVIWEATIPDYRIQENDRFTAPDGVKWFVVSARLVLWDTQWHCECQKGKV